MDTSFEGRVRTPIESEIPEGWRALELDQGKQIKTYLNKLLNQWSIVAFRTGRIEGFGYGNEFYDTYGAECDERFIVNTSEILDEQEVPINVQEEQQKKQSGQNKEEPQRQYPQDQEDQQSSGQQKNEEQNQESRQNNSNNSDIEYYYRTRRYKSCKSQVKTPIGLIKKVPLKNPVPEGWRVLQISQGRQYKKYLNKMLQEWSIVAFTTGRLDGFGYKNGFKETYGEQCGEVFIINMPKLDMDMLSTYYLTSIYDHWSENLLEEVAMQFEKKQ